MTAPLAHENSLLTTARDDAPAASEATLPEGWLAVESLDIDAQGIARRPDGKVVFIEGALPFEVVSTSVHRKKNNWEAGVVTAIHRESSQRVRPGCPHFGLHAGACGGCKMQHLHENAQVAIKQRVLEDNLWHLGKVKAQTMLRPIEGPAWGYRYRARLSVRFVHKKGEVLIGFHERKSRYVADMQVCHVLPPHVSAMLMPLRGLIFGMDARETCPQIELACGDDVTALVLRHLEPLSDDDLTRLRAFAAQHGVQWWLQSKGPDTVKLLDEGGPLLSYALPDFGITMPFKPTDFTQVNPHINRVLVSRALRLLDARKHERVIDWFCGLGNFTLPIATQAGEVLGIEGSETLVARSRENLTGNQTGRAVPLAPTAFVARNLFEMTPSQLVGDGQADKWLVDPPREGAFALAKTLADLHLQPELRGGWTPPKRIVYVSCNPATLARDAGLLVHQAGYRCVAAGVVNMFPHTAHVESMAVFELDAERLAGAV
ncbi:MAG: 23S rRNA (uracil(1939)-C(5))-methyltransferase RlmD [Gammaproteobacteria bacterium]|uniref:23S rRNA (uracil(1939)-C(5))-methyltransferase RlmD n=1 Tax=Hydrogenophaga sp. TaxID=1904254 RepID=UPI0025C42922|nr:23S rRNA (uracil(1939)-C(5))-methyltransferase RlmD [Hydrogenophaga sp.]MBU4184460.1 23S rRNA (uracil(1939)-C(5))-methyltransferase RlmD [Gammaproteobacteria bacterium]MBU4283167.1 23S rRNA (uracil(1939)-C(5))-methyltransferase RlmD [Gammaproteobacteria bacterium]MBU4505012.1 23S rRNA (uracil(1939)-C(5))-methyltransferase RlmD [Gammaproteobacteria bacterium]MCG2655867.1 23S rRNA (uracil(1939)-C(5))-methyltransferase RlmD [Hydrogenophaga sp.]